MDVDLDWRLWDRNENVLRYMRESYVVGCAMSTE